MNKQMSRGEAADPLPVGRVVAILAEQERWARRQAADAVAAPEFWQGLAQGYESAKRLLDDSDAGEGQ